MKSLIQVNVSACGCLRSTNLQMDRTSFSSDGAQETDSGIELSAGNTDHFIYIRVFVPALDVQKCLRFNVEDTVSTAKQQVLSALAKGLNEGFNYGLYCPPSSGKAGKYLDEERPLKDYPLPGPVGQLEFRYKHRIDKQQMNPRRLKQLHSKGSTKHLLDAIRKNDCVKVGKILNKGLDPNFIDVDSGETPLSLAASLSQPKSMMLTLVENGSHLDFRNKSGHTAIHKAALLGNEAALQILLDLGSSANYKDCNGLTALYLCVSSDVVTSSSVRCVTMLLYDHATLGVTDSAGWSELHQVCKAGHSQHLEQLLYYGANLNCCNFSGNTALHICAIYNQEDCAQMLLFRGASRMIRNACGQTAHELAVVTGNLQLANLIKDFSENDVVLYRDQPKYNDRRRMRLPSRQNSNLQRSFSIPSVYDGQQACQTHSLYSDEDSQLSFIRGVDSPRSLSISNNSVSFPSSDSDSCSVNGFKTSADYNGDFVQTTVSMCATSHGFGFVLRKTPGAEYSGEPLSHWPSPHCFLYIDKDSPAEKAGLQAGDFLLEVNSHNVVSIPYEQVAQMIRMGGDILELTTARLTLAQKYPGHLLPVQDKCQPALDTATDDVQCVRSCSTFDLTADCSSSFQPPANRFCSPDVNSKHKVASIHSVHGKRMSAAIPIDEIFNSPCHDESFSALRAKSTLCLFSECQTESAVRSSHRLRRPSWSDVLLQNPTYNSSRNVEGCSTFCQKLPETSDKYQFNQQNSVKVGSTSGLADVMVPKPSSFHLSISSPVTTPLAGQPTVSLKGRPPPPPRKPAVPTRVRDELVQSNVRKVHLRQRSADMLDRLQKPSTGFTQLAESVRLEVIRRRNTAALELSAKIGEIEKNEFNKCTESSVDRHTLSSDAAFSNSGTAFNSNSPVQLTAQNGLENLFTTVSDFSPKTITIDDECNDTHHNKHDRSVFQTLCKSNDTSSYVNQHDRICDTNSKPTFVHSYTGAVATGTSDVTCLHDVVVPPPPGFGDDTPDSSSVETVRNTPVPVALWTVSDVTAWLGTVGLSEHIYNFKMHGVDGMKLVSLGRSGLISLGLESVNERMKFERALRKAVNGQ